ncbi:LOW QUALITY PROTEIN: protein NDNF [Hypomesus transpacificus]|uniref:LOW QUALITY PROTEIN: protein NDNF n=1 Tax=Hypomesus transpacificus TaxID=137520 RepID=UPI001F081ABD|nr:LOW QUALITY PROTEIN: protein NDNF [Hypomesus transpacificus]
MALSWYLCLVLALLSGPSWQKGHSAMALVLAPENEVPLRPTSWLPAGKLTTIHLPKGRTRRLYFTLKKKAAMMSLTVSPCDLPVEWTLVGRSLKDKAPKSLHWSSKKSVPEVWWQAPGIETKIHTYTGNAMDTYSGPSYAQASIYILRLRSKDQDTSSAVYLHEGPGPSGAFPELPPDPRVHTLGVGMTSVTLSWSPSSTQARLPHSQPSYEYCVLVNRQHNYRSLCAAREGIRREKEREKTRERKEKKKKVTVWPILKDWWWQQWDANPDPKSPAAVSDDKYSDLPCVCEGLDSVCTVSDLFPDTQYFFDVFVRDLLNGTSTAYTGMVARTHEEARSAISPLREGELRWVTFRDGGSSEEFFSFRPRGWQQSGLLTLQSCRGSQRVKVTVSGKGQVLSSQAVGEDLVQLWLQGSPSYLITWKERTTGPVYQPASDPAGALRASVKMQTSSAYHRKGVPSLPSTLQIKSFNRLRSCDAVTLAWMGTEERSLYCVYRRRLGEEEAGGRGGKGAATGVCVGPESRSDTERVLCKYFQELNPRRAVTTAVIGGLEAGAAYVFDVYLMRRWGIPVKYASKTIRTRREC